MLTSLLNLIAFKLGWIAAVGGASQESLWLGPAVIAAIVLVHVSLVRETLAEFAFVVAVGLAGAALDSGMSAAGLIQYPTSEAGWAFGVVPPWIAALWVLFATLPRYSLRWLSGRPLLAVLFGAVGGPLSFLAGSKLGVIAPGETAWLTYAALALEYAVALPIIMLFAPARQTDEVVAARSA